VKGLTLVKKDGGVSDWIKMRKAMSDCPDKIVQYDEITMPKATD